ncbi:MAG TPA: bifunctional UDP-sugar hydrolase/5'-nucleotidase [Bacillales bacterium]|nr:bifunctional UDP-sugar hydrolase/5'-nucleotidase [Bacillales bacterium]
MRLLKTLHIYHTNDLHSHFLHWPKITAYLKDAKRRHRLQGEPVLQFDIGDHIDRFHPMTEGTAGRGNVRLLNEAGYDAVAIGNNEGVTLSKEQLERLYDKANFPVLTANLFHEQGTRPSSMQPYERFTLDNGLTVAAIGITIPFTAFYEPLGWDVRHPLDMLANLVREAKKRADIVVLLSHMGYSFDRQIARDFQGIDIILGAHTHHLLKQGVNMKGTTITQCGKFGCYVGEIKVTYDADRRQVVDCEAKSVSIESYREDEETRELLENLTAEGIRGLESTVTVLKEPLAVSWFKPSPFVMLLAEALKDWCDAEISMVNAGILLDSLPTGRVTKADLHRICPHPINPCKLKLSGAELREMIRQSFTDEMRRLEIKGLGFRGKVLGAMVFHGVNVKTEQNHVRSIEILGAPLDPGKVYEVATLDMFTFGKIFPGLAEKEKHYFLPEMLRDILAWKLSKS